MAYKKRVMYIPNPRTAEQMILALKERNIDGVRNSKIMQLVYEPTPMSKIRWAKWLGAEDMERYLIPAEETSTTEEVDDIDGI